jgi:prephenate dehydratase
MGNHVSQSSLNNLAYLGPPGTFTHAAMDRLSRPWFGPSTPKATVNDVIFAVESGEVAAGLVPLENSIEGDVSGTLDELIFYSSMALINEEVVVPISFALAASGSNAKLSEIKTITTHPHAAAQCKLIIDELGAEVQFTSSTAEACRLAADMSDPSVGVVASTKAVEAYGLFVVREKVEDFSGAETRMALLKRTLARPTGRDKTSLVITPMGDRTGVLAEILLAFSSRDIGLTTANSRPLKTRLGEYCFLVTARGHLGESNMRGAIQAIADLNCVVKILGTFPESQSATASRVGEVIPPGSTDRNGAAAWIDHLLQRMQ